MKNPTSDRLLILSAVLFLVLGLCHCGNQISGPVPVITRVEVVPAGGGTMNWEGIATGWNGEKTVIRISGDDFAPLPEDAAGKEKPGLLLPHVWLLCDPPLELENILWLDAQNLLATVPAGINTLPDIFKIFGLRITNPSGGEAEFENAFEVSSLRPPQLGPEQIHPSGSQGIVPWAANRSENIQVLIVGEDFVDNSSLILTSGETSLPAVPTTFLYAQAVSATIPAPDLDLGVYDVNLVNPDGQYATLAAAFSIVGGSNPAPEYYSSFPPAGYSGSRENLTVYGLYFFSETRVFLGKNPGGYPSPVTTVETEQFFLDEYPWRYPLPNPFLINMTVSFNDRLDLRIPPGLPSGNYDLIIVNSDGQAEIVPEAYRVNENPRPVIFYIDPTFICWYSTSTFLVNIYGANFQIGARAYLASDSNIYISDPASQITSDVFHAYFATPPDNVVYDVVVLNPDGSVAGLSDVFWVNPQYCP